MTAAEEIFRGRDRSEGRLARAIRRIVRQFLGRIPHENYTTIALGDLYGWWAEGVDEDLLRVVREIWADAYGTYRNGPVLTTSLAGMESYMARVKDRLVRGIDPPLPEAAFDQVRLAVVTGAALGWSRADTARQIAKSLSWEKDGAFWRGVKQQATDRIDEILDPLGPPGTLARENAREYDPVVQAWRNQSNLATRHLDAEHSYWETRAMRIARTESTGAFNAAALTALHDEGFAYKEWLATEDTRTRETHRLADGQRVALLSPFLVGGARLQIPGDPTGPPEETVNCRCAVLGADDAQ